jgi:hypothetical protein
MPHYRLAQQEEGPHSSNRCWNLALTFWTFRWQIAQAGASGREAIDQARNLCQVQKRPLPPDKTSPYCQARGQLPLERLDDIHQALLTEAQAAVATKDLWCGLRVHLVDGSTLTAPDTPENQALSCKTPENLEREIRLHLLMHNLVRRVMLQAARRHRVPLNRLSFAGALAAARRGGEALLQARSQRQRQELLDGLFRGIAADLLPDRPGRREPRAVKRRPKPYPRLMCHRS